MFEYPPLVQARLAERGAIAVRHLIWFEYKDPATGAADPLGIWDGDDVQLFNVLGGAKTFWGAGAVLGIDDITTSLGLDVRYNVLSLSGVHPQVVNALRGRKTKLCRTYIFRLFIDPASGVAIANPIRIFKGWVDSMELPREAVNRPVNFSVRLASNSRILTRTVPALRSREGYMLRGDDNIYQYAIVSGDVKAAWGPQ